MVQKGSRPLNPMAARPREPGQTQAPQPGQVPGLLGMIPGAEAFGKKPGPLGMRAVSSDAMQKILRLKQEMGVAQASAPIPVMAGGGSPHPEMVSADQLGAGLFGGAMPTEVAPSVDPGTVKEPVAPTLPTPPSPMAFGQPQPPVTAPVLQEDPEEKKLPTTEPPSDPTKDPKFMKTPMHAIAGSGAESRIYQNLRYDPEWAESILWKAAPERRKHFAESRVGEIDWSSLFTAFDIRQEVTVWKTPQDIKAVFRTMSADDEVAVRRILSEDYAKTDAEYEVGTIITTVAAGLVSIAGSKLPSLPPPKTKLEDRVKIMRERIDFVLRLPYTLLTDLAINYAWFVMRVSDAQRAGDLGNG